MALYLFNYHSFIYCITS